jgi:hypothetical protein
VNRLAAENPDDERYQSLEGQREVLIEKAEFSPPRVLDVNEDGTLTPPVFSHEEQSPEERFNEGRGYYEGLEDRG